MAILAMLLWASSGRPGDSMNELLKSKLVNGWKLFWLITAPISLVMVLAMFRADLASAEEISSLIQLSVRCAVPLVFVTFAASSLQVVFPGSFSRWLLRNRKFMGFASRPPWPGRQYLSCG